MAERSPAAAQALHLLRARFPEHASRIERAYWRYESFRSLCEDYRECLAVLMHLGADDTDSGAERRAEYTRLLEELGCEVRTWLGPVPGPELERGNR